MAALPGLTLSRRVAPPPSIRKVGNCCGCRLRASLNRRKPLAPPGGGHAQPDSASVEAALAGYVRQREAVMSAEVDQDLPNRLRFAVVVEELAVWARDLAVATRIMQGDRVPEPPDTIHSRTVLVFSALYAVAVVQTVPWSFHSPVCVLSECSPVGGRAGCGAGRRGAGPFPRFLVLLATLTLMRTSVTATRAAVLPAFLGTVAGGLIAALVLALAGTDAAV